MKKIMKAFLCGIIILMIVKITDAQSITDEKFDNTLKDFITAIKNYDTKALDLLIFKKTGYYKMFNPGVLCCGSKYKKSNELFVAKNDTVNTFLRFNPQTMSDKIYNQSPRGNFCEGYPDDEDGNYIVSKVIVSRLAGKYMDYITETGSCLSISSKYFESSAIEVVLIKNHEFVLRYYFFQVNENWYFLMADFCDCSV